MNSKDKAAWKKKLIAIRNGGYITPVLESIVWLADELEAKADSFCPCWELKALRGGDGENYQELLEDLRVSYQELQTELYEWKNKNAKLRTQLAERDKQVVEELIKGDSPKEGEDEERVG